MVRQSYQQEYVMLTSVGSNDPCYSKGHQIERVLVIHQPPPTPAGQPPHPPSATVVLGEPSRSLTLIRPPFLPRSASSPLQENFSSLIHWIQGFSSGLSGSGCHPSQGLLSVLDSEVTFGGQCFLHGCDFAVRIEASAGSDSAAVHAPSDKTL